MTTWYYIYIRDVLLASAVLTLLAMLIMSMLVRWLKLERQNFRGDWIPTGYGFSLVLAASPLLIWQPLALTAIAGFGILGLIDDIFGNREVGGFKGHLRLLAQGKVSTGLIKAVGGGVLALWIGVHESFGYIPTGILNGLVISLSANMLNLLDLRPGRAVSCWWVGMLALGFAPDARYIAILMLPVFIPAIWLSVLDRSAKVMMGDAGSNVLGAILGLAIVYSLGLPGKLALVILMAAVNIYSEKYSISRLIENNAVLTRLDRLLGER